MSIYCVLIIFTPTIAMSVPELSPFMRTNEIIEAKMEDNSYYFISI